MLHFPCLVLDHDDTVVKSTPTIHYPSFIESLRILRPEMEISLDAFLRYVYDPGFFVFCRDICGFSEKEVAFQGECWRAYIRTHRAAPYEGFGEIFRMQKEAGGRICVVSHSSDEVILRDYKENFSIEPDLIFSSDLPPEQRKPSTYPLLAIMENFGLRPDELIMVDDLLPGCNMAHECGVTFAAAGWSQTIPELAADLREKSEFYLDTVDSLRHLLFD